jgi:predicted nucleic acid-binding Zn ribbon protein
MASEERLFQGPIADALTHSSQLAMMRRLAGLKIKGENYYRADIRTGARSSLCHGCSSNS